jgi:hypothetical protein
MKGDHAILHRIHEFRVAPAQISSSYAVAVSEDNRGGYRANDFRHEVSEKRSGEPCDSHCTEKQEGILNFPIGQAKWTNLLHMFETQSSNAIIGPTTRKKVDLFHLARCP